MTHPANQTPHLPADLHLVREVLVQYKPSPVPRLKVRTPNDIASFFRTVAPDNSREHMVAMYLDGNHQLIAFAIISTGTANMTVAVPREILQRALFVGAISIVIAHNHPSDSLEPSREDESITRKLFESARLMGINLLDHVLVTNQDALSFRNDRAYLFIAD